MAKRTVTAADMAARLIGQPQQQAPEGTAETKFPAAPERTSSARLAKADPAPPSSGTKRLNLNISVPQWRKLKTCAMDRGTTASDLVREFIDGL